MNPKSIIFFSRFSATLFLMAFALVTQAQSPTMSERFTMSGAMKLDVLTSGGFITVEGTSGNTAKVDVFVKQRGKVLSASDPAMDDVSNAFDFKMEKNGQTLLVYAKRRENGMNLKNISFSFAIAVPRNASTNLKTSGGKIVLEDVRGNHKLTTSGGGITLTDVSGETDARTSGGSIRVANQDGDVNLRTSGGRIEIQDSEGDMYAHTSGGSIRLEDVKGSIDAGTSGGSIRIYGEADAVKAGTSGGSIDVKITGLTRELSLSTSGGSIDAELPEGMGMDLDLRANRVNVDAYVNFSGTMKKNRVDGAMNGGGIPVRMSTSGGSIDLVFN